MQGLNLAVNFMIISLYVVRKVACSSLKVWVKGRTGQEFHSTRKMLTVGGGGRCLVVHSVPRLTVNCGKWQG